MRLFMNILGGIISIYMILIFIRIILTWFAGVRYGRPYEALCRITDPYLDWFRRFPIFRLSVLDLSPIAALATLALLNNVFITLGRYGRISVGIILSMIFSAVWSILSFVLGFFLVALILRLIAYLISANTYAGFWRLVDTIARPAQYRVNRIFFRGRLVNYIAGLITPIAVLLVLLLVCGRLAALAEKWLLGLPF